MEQSPIELEFSDDDLERGVHNTLVHIIAGIAGISLAAAGAIVTKKIYEAKREAYRLKNKEEDNE